MNTTLLTALLALVPISMLLFGAALLFSKNIAWSSFLQLFGAGCLVIVALTHMFEALHWFAGMRWGSPDSVGHYLDLSSAVLGLTCFPIGYLLHALAVGRSKRRGKPAHTPS